ncbi:MAG: hypothetical protein WCV90_04485 [Candidatus Woesearchaeota archaeon]|jgi:hypothetical protein
MNKKGQIEDFADWLILILGIILLVIFIQITVIKALDDKTAATIEHLDRTETVNNYLILQRVHIEQGEPIDPEVITREIKMLRTGQMEYVPENE